MRIWNFKPLGVLVTINRMKNFGLFTLFILRNKLCWQKKGNIFLSAFWQFWDEARGDYKKLLISTNIHGLAQ